MGLSHRESTTQHTKHVYELIAAAADDDDYYLLVLRTQKSVLSTSSLNPKPNTLASLTPPPNA